MSTGAIDESFYPRLSHLMTTASQQRYFYLDFGQQFGILKYPATRVNNYVATVASSARQTQFI